MLDTERNRMIRCWNLSRAPICSLSLDNNKLRVRFGAVVTLSTRGYLSTGMIWRATVAMLKWRTGVQLGQDYQG